MVDLKIIEECLPLAPASVSIGYIIPQVFNLSIVNAPADPEILQ